ncbi:MAG: hypothetical protein J7K49_04930 [Thaumarchaeota archaeon]|nr:hypothetical protein [Nitrososphaerota archaeon]
MAGWWVWILVAAAVLVVLWRLKVIRVSIRWPKRREFFSRLLIKNRPVAGVNFHREYSKRRELHIHLGKRRINIYPRRKKRKRRRR